MSIATISLDALYVTSEELRPFLRDGIVLEGKAILNTRTDNYSVVDLLEAAADRVEECSPKARIEWVEDGTTRNVVSLTISYPGLSSQVVEDRFEQQPLEVDYNIWHEEAWFGEQ